MSTISGGGSLDVARIVAQLMTVERQPLNALQRRENQLQSRLSAFGRVQGALAELGRAAATLRSTATFQATQATVSGEAATASAQPGAVAGRYTLSVSALARAQSSASALFSGAGATVGNGQFTISRGGAAIATVAVAAGDTLADLRDRINAAGSDVRASIVGDGAGVRLVLNSATGAASAFALSADAGLAALAFTATQSAQDARFRINGLALTSSGNTVSGAIAGVTLTLTRAPTDAQAAAGATVDAEIAVAPDARSAREAGEAFVKAYNGLVALIDELTRFDPATRSAGALNAEGALRSIRSMMRAIAVDTRTGVADGELTRLAQVGIEIQADGRLRFNAQTFDATFQAQPGRVERLFAAAATDGSRGLALRLQELAQSITQSGGVLASRQDGLRATIRRIDDQQAQLEARLALTEKRLSAQYARLDALLGTRQQQSNALAAALAGLPKQE